MPLIDPDRVDAIFRECLFDTDNDAPPMVTAEGVVCTVGFDKNRLERHRDEIVAMLRNLPNDFHQSGGGGMSFLSACADKNGDFWTGSHQQMEQLFQLGIGLGIVRNPMAAIPIPRAFWPGGVPYYVVLNQPVTE